MKTLKYLMAAAAVSLAFTAQAQTLLDEDFETGNTGSALTPVAKTPGWTTVNSYTGANTKYVWHNYYSEVKDNAPATISGNCCAAVDGALFSSDAEGKGPREEMLITPELDLNDTYQLMFSFKVSPVNHTDHSNYDLQVRVVSNDNLQNTETIFSIHNSNMLHDAGITTFPIDDWGVYTAKIDLSDFMGEKVKLAFVYKMNTDMANVCYLDDVSVKQFTPPTGPIAVINNDRFTFGEAFIGERIYSEVFTITNQGKDGLQVTSVDLPAGFECTLDRNINLGSYSSAHFQFVYAPTLTSAATGTAVIHTTGGDLSVDLSATKQFVPEGFYLETFNGSFPPAGWANNGWGASPQALEGERSAMGQGGYTKETLRSPKIDLTDGGHLKFTYFNYFASDDDSAAPQYDITVEVSYDGGDNWITKWTSDWQYGLNQTLTADIDLGYGDDNCYVRWVYPAVESDDEGAYEHSIFYLDRVLLPNLVGAGGAPLRATIVAPVNGAVDVATDNVKLEWGPAQFAEGYKLFVGTNTEANDLINGLDLGTALNYTIPDKLEYSTKYYWKVVAYNTVGDGAASRWNFTTQADATVKEYPYVENFDNTDSLPIGWTCIPGAGTYNKQWFVNSHYPYVDAAANAQYNAATSGWLNPDDHNGIVSPVFTLPEDKPMNISFLWGDQHPSSLVIDPAGAVAKQNVTPNNGVSYTNFDILAEGEWTTLSTLSENPIEGTEESKYWRRENIDLSAYAGKEVQFRWMHYSLRTSDDGCSVTHIVVDVNRDNLAEFNVAGWDAGKVNYNKAINSGDIFTMFNRGTADLNVKDVTFTSGNFEASIKAGDVIKVGESTPFNIQFNSNGTVGKVEDAMIIEFATGYKATLPVSAEGLDKDVVYYSFEPNALDYVWDEDFMMIDADHSPNYTFSSSWVHYSADGMRCAFSAENDSKENGLYGMMSPISGIWALVGASPQYTSADNWIISKPLWAKDNSSFDFYARNWACNQTVLPNLNHNVSVLVTEVIDNPKTTDFTTVMRETEMPLLDNDNWHHYNVELGDYAGKQIRVALRHTTNGPSDLAFFDDFTLNHFDATSGISDVVADVEGAFVEVFNVSGVKVAEGEGTAAFNGLQHGFYVVRATNGNAVKSFSIVR